MKVIVGIVAIYQQHCGRCSMLHQQSQNEQEERLHIRNKSRK
jgi:hypothetical protein